MKNPWVLGSILMLGPGLIAMQLSALSSPRASIAINSNFSRRKHILENRRQNAQMSEGHSRTKTKRRLQDEAAGQSEEVAKQQSERERQRQTDAWNPQRQADRVRECVCGRQHQKQRDGKKLKGIKACGCSEKHHTDDDCSDAASIFGFGGMSRKGRSPYLAKGEKEKRG